MLADVEYSSYVTECNLHNVGPGLHAGTPSGNSEEGSKLTRAFPTSPQKESTTHILFSLTDFPDLLKKIYQISWEAPENVSA